jgi:hypothetical protein
LLKIFSFDNIAFSKISLRKKTYLHTIGLKMAAIHTTIRHPQIVQRSWLHHYWWVLAFAALCGVLYLHGVRQKNIAYFEMTGRLQTLEKEKALALAQQEELLLQIQSQSDPAWVEMILKRNLCLVPESQTKFYFRQD